MRATHTDTQDLTIRRLGRGDDAALERLAQRDSAPTPSGEMLGAFAGGELIAATAMAGGRPVADPFRPTAEVVRMLVLRTEQLRGAARGGRRRRRPAARRLLRPAYGAAVTRPRPRG